jgi:hypothetical protein
VALHPFTVRPYGIPGYDERVPDDSKEGEAAWRARVKALTAEARSLEKAKPDFAGGDRPGAGSWPYSSLGVAAARPMNEQSTIRAKV